MLESLDIQPPNRALLATLPPYLVATIAGRIGAHFSDKRRRLRSPFLLAYSVLAIAGLSMMAFTTTQAIQYIGTFLVTLPLCASLPMILAWQADNVRGQWKRAAGTSLLVCASAAGGMAASFAFRVEEDTPRFYNAFGFCIGAMALSICVILFLCYDMQQENKRAGLSGTEGLEGFQYTL